MAKCRYCRKEIVWKTVNGIATPLDPELISYEDAAEGDYIVTDQGHQHYVSRIHYRPDIVGRVVHRRTCSSISNPHTVY